eukprot:CAMPEP_0116912728 /NCGR_PEP_ID=MMETSP0467-20121206/16266_1 /TAXON_ID=283647 /ORGANISM="Mesodinium pulex, Strain SPMC105" /LENGTH=55 /DNA_ID=CAMNT_0004588777 /DNA_START=1554 /DNA_END=1721 /DNA_ORIENTATION=-
MAQYFFNAFSLTDPRIVTITATSLPIGVVFISIILMNIDIPTKEFTKSEFYGKDD